MSSSAGIDAFFGGVDWAKGNELFRAVAHGGAAGLIRSAQGGNFWHGFASASVSSLMGSLVDGSTYLEGLILTAVSGGATEEISGGNFQDGALTAAMVYLMNHRRHSRRDGLVRLKRQLQDGDPYQFRFFPKEKESDAYAFMLAMQKRDDVEVAAYMVTGPKGDGILVLPWFGNSDRGAEHNVAGMDGLTVFDDSGKAYQALALVHTHRTKNGDAYDAIIPSSIARRGDLYTLRELGLPGYIITNQYYSELNCRIPYHQHVPTGLTTDLSFLNEDSDIFFSSSFALLWRNREIPES